MSKYERSLLKDTAENDSEEQKVQLGPRKERRKTWFGLEKKRKKINQNYQRLPLLTVLPLNYFMQKAYKILHQFELRGIS